MQFELGSSPYTGINALFPLVSFVARKIEHEMTVHKFDGKTLCAIYEAWDCQS